MTANVSYVNGASIYRRNKRFNLNFRLGEIVVGIDITGNGGYGIVDSIDLNSAYTAFESTEFTLYHDAFHCGAYRHHCNSHPFFKSLEIGSVGTFAEYDCARAYLLRLYGGNDYRISVFVDKGQEFGIAQPVEKVFGVGTQYLFFRFV